MQALVLLWGFVVVAVDTQSGNLTGLETVADRSAHWRIRQNAAHGRRSSGKLAACYRYALGDDPILENSKMEHGRRYAWSREAPCKP